MKARIWGSCGSLPSPATSACIRGKVKAALWAARKATFETEADVDSFMDGLPHYLKGTFRANTSCVEIQTRSEEVILCDAGSGIRDYSLALGANSPPRTYHIFISHLHWDHIQGFPFFAPAYQPGNHIIFHGFHEATEAVIKQQMEAPCFPVPFSTMQAKIEFDIRPEGACFEIGHIPVRSIKQKHPGDSWGYRFEEDGKSIVYSSDSEHAPDDEEPNARFIDFFSDAEVVIFDGQYTLEQASTDRRNWGHSNNITGVQLAALAKVRDLIVFHHEPAYRDREVEAILQDALNYREIYHNEKETPEADRFPKQILFAYDGLEAEA